MFEKHLWKSDFLSKDGTLVENGLKFSLRYKFLSDKLSDSSFLFILV